MCLKGGCPPHARTNNCFVAILQVGVTRGRSVPRWGTMPEALAV